MNINTVLVANVFRWLQPHRIPEENAHGQVVMRRGVDATLRDTCSVVCATSRLDIPLKNIMEQLSLTFSQIQELCSQKLKHNLTTINIENTQ